MGDELEFSNLLASQTPRRFSTEPFSQTPRCSHRVRSLCTVPVRVVGKELMATFAVEEANSEKTDRTPVGSKTAQSLAITDPPIPMTSDG